MKKWQLICKLHLVICRFQTPRRVMVRPVTLCCQCNLRYLLVFICHLSDQLPYDTILLQWRHNDLDGVSNHQPHDCLLKRLFTHRSKKTSKLRVTGLCVGNSPVAGELSTQRATNADNASIWWRHHNYTGVKLCTFQWLIFNDIAHNEMVFSGWVIHHLIMFACIS